MSYSRFKLGFTRDPKVAALSDAAFRVWVSAIDYALEQNTNGKLPKRCLDLISRGPRSGKKRLALILEIEGAGLWYPTADGWDINESAVRSSGQKTSTFVYFMRAHEGGPIKIGVAADPRQRQRKVSQDSGKKLEILGVINCGSAPAFRVEARLHNRFAADRLNGEWFRCSRALLDCIESECGEDSYMIIGEQIGKPAE